MKNNLIPLVTVLFSISLLGMQRKRRLYTMTKYTVSLLFYCLLATASLIFCAQQPSKQGISPKNTGTIQKNLLEVPKEYFRCLQCDRSFKSNDLLELHKKQHDGQKVFTCDLCAQLFLKPDEYTDHYLSCKKFH